MPSLFRISSPAVAAFAVALFTALGSPRVEADEPVASADYFESQVRPILASRCLKCHGDQKQEGGLRLDSRQAMLDGGESGAALVLDSIDESLLLAAVRYEGPEMPPSGPLEETEIAALERWVAAGAVWPEHAANIREATAGVTEADRQWWSFRPLDKPEPPPLDDDWGSNSIDAFILRSLDERGLRPAPEADRRTLVRRLYFDLLGLPPSPEEVEAFLQDDSEDAWPALVERLLDDQRYGEHWARFWLDLVRYAESDGWNQDAYRPEIWRYRDYVVGAFNDDTPYPQFVRDQLAGDEIPGDDPTKLAAAGFLRLGIYEYNQRDARSHWNDVMNETTDVVGDAFLGLGMACARCHDHKFDPILQSDYFALRAFFEPVVWRDDLVAATEQEQAVYRERLAKWEAATAEVRERIDAFLKPFHERQREKIVGKFPLDIQACFFKPESERNSWEQQMAYLVDRQFYEEGGGPLAGLSQEEKTKLESLQAELAEFDDLKPEPLPKLMTATDFSGESAPTTLPDDASGTPIAPAYLTVLSPPGGESADCGELPDSSGRRTALAAWIGSNDNPLTTRVIVNRIWRQHFGRGLAPAANDFGRLGGEPTHPELLDWLAAKFVEEGWSFKKLHKLILTSATWRQASANPRADAYAKVDSAGDFYWQFEMRRLTAEQLRDALLTVTGELDATLGGPSVDAQESRRGLYVKRFRNTPDAFLHTFDATSGLKSVAQRDVTTTPTQSLLMINGDYVLERASRFAERLREEELGSPAKVAERAFLLAWGREPTSDEARAAVACFTRIDEEGAESIDDEGLIDFCHVLLSSNEFLYLD